MGHKPGKPKKKKKRFLVIKSNSLVCHKTTNYTGKIKKNTEKTGKVHLELNRVCFSVVSINVKGKKKGLNGQKTRSVTGLTLETEDTLQFSSSGEVYME